MNYKHLLFFTILGTTLSVASAQDIPCFDASMDSIEVNSPSYIIAEDLDGDQKTDLVIASNNYEIVVLKGRGNKTFDPPQRYPLNNYAYKLQVADLDNDGLKDIVVDSGRLILWNSKTNTFSQTETGNSSQFQFALSDANNDFLLDIVTPLGVQINLGGRKFRAPIYFGTSSFSNAQNAVAMSDINKDGKTDMIVSGPNSGVSILYNLGFPVFSQPVQIDHEEAATLLAVDMNNDGFEDIVSSMFHSDNSEGIRVFLNNKSGYFDQPVVYKYGTFPQVMDHGDFNNDGFTDLASDANSQILTSINNRNGGIQSVTHNVGSKVRALAVGDIDSDHYDDIIVGYTGKNSIRIFYSNIPEIRIHESCQNKETTIFTTKMYAGYNWSNGATGVQEQFVSKVGQYYVDVLLVNPFETCNARSNTVTINSSICLGTEEILKPLIHLEISPNPTSDFLKVQAEPNYFPLTIHLYDKMGALKLTKKLESSTDLIQLSEFANGIYLLNIELANGTKQDQKLAIIN
ncbi:MAG: T9SS type A sorting domain-containing protein [Opitutaceae bacterium]|nr:T9SS type A sorting domain-containing protein [Cytophagales bacterium]